MHQPPNQGIGLVSKNARSGIACQSFSDEARIGDQRPAQHLFRELGHVGEMLQAGVRDLLLMNA